MNKWFSGPLKRAISVASILALTACAGNSVDELGMKKNPDGTFTNYRGITYAPKYAPVQNQIESRDYKPVGEAYQQVGEPRTTAVGGNDLGHDMAVQAVNIPAAIAGGLSLGKSMPGVNVQGSTAKAAAGQSQATSGTAGNVTINQ
ncbi:MAG: hypothetical protein UY94_C0026G0001 [Parcubacteria group bacterium GW2011_GWA2_56_21]|nr:MAG: hypothetical protein UY94_C0026G0001 [Parcubacteria group bacterium GW2011_GWA2_56_21]